MTIGKLLHWLYCLDLSDATLLLLVCSAVFCLLKRRFEQHSWWKWLVALLLFAASAGAIYTTLGTRTGGGNLQVNLIPFHSYREVLAGGNPEIFRSNFMNAVLFYPAGLLATALLPEKWPGWCRCVLVVLLLGALSVGIEYAQYFWRLGRVEIDDVIHNTAGALAGSLAALLIPPLLGWLWNILKRLLTRYLGRKDT